MTLGSLEIGDILVVILFHRCRVRTPTAMLTLGTPPVSLLGQEKVKKHIDNSFRRRRLKSVQIHTGIKATYPKVAFICNYSNFANYLFNLVEAGMTCTIRLLWGIKGDK